VDIAKYLPSKIRKTAAAIKFDEKTAVERRAHFDV